MSESEMREFNPWWADRRAIDQDREIRAWQDSHIKFVPGLKDETRYDFEPDNTVIYTLRGPRMVGKTTMLKMQIRDLLESGVKPWNILYYSLDLKDAKGDIVEMVRTHEKTIPDGTTGRRYLFLDEITSVADWEKAIKHLVALGRLENCTVMATGSQAVGIKRAVESLPGRRGSVDDYHNKVLLPMKFSEYCAARSPELRDLMAELGLGAAERRGMFEGLLRQEVDPRLEKIRAHHNELARLFGQYVLTGGMPRVVDEYASTGSVAEGTYEDYLGGIKGEWRALQKNEVMLGGFCRAVIRSQSNPVSWAGLAADAALGSPRTAVDYADVLADAFVISMAYRYDHGTGGPLVKKNAKIHFLDPFFLHVFNGWNAPGDPFDTGLKYSESDENLGRIAEGVVASHLARWAFDHGSKRMFNPLGSVMYWQDGSGREVDFVLRHGAEAAPIEVKFGGSVNHRKLGGLASFLDETGCGGGLVLSREEMSTNSGYVVVPAPVFLMLV